MLNKNNVILIVMFILPILVGTFKSWNYKVEIDYGGSAYWVKKSWWGFKEEIIPLKIIRGEWHFKARNGEWVPVFGYIAEEDDIPEPSTASLNEAELETLNKAKLAYKKAVRQYEDGDIEYSEFEKAKTKYKRILQDLAQGK